MDIGTIFFPFVLSFDKKVAFYRQWTAVFLAGFLVGVPFLVWDYFFTKNLVWGFNPDYLIGLYVTNLPIEEVLFFVVVPYSCVFIYACVKAYFSHLRFNTINRAVYVFLGLYILFISYTGWGGAYAMYVVSTALITLIISLRFREILQYLPVSFLISIIPFMLVNGVLTGGFTSEPIVWYDDAERCPYRIFTIPAEDILYSFTLIGLNIAAFEWIQKSRLAAKS